MASYYINCALDTVNTIILFFLIRTVYKRSLPAFVAAIIFAVNTYNCTQVIAGKETALINLVILIALWSVHSARTAILPWCANILFLLRPEGIFATLIILSTTLKRPGRKALKGFILPCAITCLWYCFLLVYFGSIVPHGMIAKHKVLMAGDFFSVFMGTFTNIGLLFTNSSIYLVIPGLERWPFLLTSVAIVVYACLRLKEPCWVMYRNIAIVQLLVLMLADTRVFSWYYCWFPLLIPIIMAELSAAAWSLAETDNVLALWTQRCAVCLFMFFSLRGGLFFAPYAWMPYLERGVAYREAALFLQDKTTGKETAAACDIGILGYFYHGPVLDLMGLISPKALDYYPIKTNNTLLYLIPPDAIAAFKPKYLMASFGHCKMLLDDNDFRRNYTEIKRWTNPAMTDGVLCIWERNPI